MWVYFWALYSVPLVYVSVFVPVPCCFDYHGLVLQFDIRQCDTSKFVFLPQYCCGYSRYFVVPHKFWIICSSSVKYAIGILIGIALSLQIALGSMHILMMLIFPLHEHSICFHLFVSSVSFFSVLQLSEYRSFIFLVRFIPR